MFEVTDMLFMSGKKYVLCLGILLNNVDGIAKERPDIGYYFVVSLLAERLDVTYQKLNVIARKHRGRFKKRFINGESYITFDNKEDAENCVEELNALLIARELIK